MGETDAEYLKMLELQRQAFEAQFGSLESMGYEDKTKEGDDSESSDVDSFSGGSDLSDKEGSDESEQDEEQFRGFDEEDDVEDKSVSKSADIRQPKVIKFSGANDTYVPPSKKEQKLLRSGKTLNKNRKLLESEGTETKPGDDEGEDMEMENLQNDIELQRFLKESHLLSAFNSATSGASLTLDGLKDTTVSYQDDEVMGKARARTLEMRLQNISKVNGDGRKISKLEKVPMHVRKGMIDKHVKRIKKYEEEAADAGIVLSKVKSGNFRKIESTYVKDIERRIGSSIKSKDLEKSKKRTRGLKVQSVGRSTRNGLVISSEDIARINGSGKSKRRR